MTLATNATALTCRTKERRSSTVVRAAALALVVTVAPGGGLPEERARFIELTLADAVHRAEETSDAVAMARAEVDRAAGDEQQARSRRWPQLFATASYTRTLASEFTEALGRGPDGGGEGGTGGGGGGGGGAGGDLETSFRRLPFGRKNTWRAGLSVAWELWAGGEIGAGVTAASAAAENQRLALDAARARAILDAVQAYYDATLADRLLAIAEASLDQADRALRLAREEQAAGARPEFELLRAQVTRDNLVPDLERRRIDRDLALLRLRELLDLPLDVELRLTTAADRLDELERAVPAVADVASVPAPEAERRVPVREAELVIRAREAALAVARSGRLPSVVLISDYGLVQYPDDPWPTGMDWRNNWTVGIGLQVPLFTGFRLTGEARSADADLALARATLRRAVESSRLDTESARRELAAAAATYDATGGTEEQATRAFAIAEARYREGISTLLEWNDARLQLQQASANRARAARDLQVARLRVALLPRLPFADDGSSAASATVPATPSAETAARRGRAGLNGPAAVPFGPAGRTGTTPAF